MMMAYYTKQVIKAKTAVIERNLTGHLDSLCEEEVYSIKGIDILKEKNINSLSLDYSYLFFDYGTRIGQIQGKNHGFFDCSIKIITASLSFWKQKELFHFVEEWSKVQGNEEWIYLIPFASSSAIKKMQRQLGRKLYAVMPEQEWWRMGAENLILYDKILRE